MTPAWGHRLGAGAQFINCYQPLQLSGRLQPLPGRPSRRSASAKRRCSSTLRDPSLCCGARSSSWCPHGAATAAKEHLLHLRKSTAMTARRCAPPRSSPLHTYVGELCTITHGTRYPATVVHDAAASVCQVRSDGAKGGTITPLTPSERALAMNTAIRPLGGNA